MTKPIIGIVGNILINNGPSFSGYERAYVNNDYVKAVIKAGGVPIILPIVDDEDFIIEQIKTVDGILITGGGDINPLDYGEEPCEKLGYVLPERDKFDFLVIKIASKLNKPILGICKGLQALNVALGGTLYQDLSYIDGCYIKHMQDTRSNAISHTVRIVKNTKLHKIFGDKVITNSFHHQAVKDLAPDFKISALSKDGVVEGIEKQGEDFIVGVQWHPEMLAANGNLDMLKLFKTFISIADKNQ